MTSESKGNFYSISEFCCVRDLIHRLVSIGNHETYVVMVRFFANCERVYHIRDMKRDIISEI